MLGVCELLDDVWKILGDDLKSKIDLYRVFFVAGFVCRLQISSCKRKLTATNLCKSGPIEISKNIPILIFRTIEANTSFDK